MLILKSAGCGTLTDWAKQNKYWHTYNEVPKPGWLPIFDFNGKHASRDHIGVVVSVSGSTINTIEGNTGSGNEANGGAVMERQRNVAYITGYIAPPYTSTQTAAKLLSIAKAEVGVKESPANSNNVKYNTWYYGREVYDGLWGTSFPWCAAFVCWLFAVLAGEIKNAPTGNTETGGAAKIKAFQKWLNTTYKTSLAVDGEYGPKTKAAAIKGVQTWLNTETDAGLLVDGVYGPLTAFALSKVDALKKGAKGGPVYILQGLLYCRGYDPNGFDGDFGVGTDAAVRKFQTAKGLTVDGEAGPRTFSALF